MANPTYPPRIINIDELADVVLRNQALALVYSQGREPVFRRLELGDERPTYAYLPSEQAWVLVNVTRAKDV